jgi:tubulin epsilon
LLALSNNTCIGGTFEALANRYVKLYRSKAYVHHFTSEGMDAEELPAAHESCAELIRRYAELDGSAGTEPEPEPRLSLL